MRTTRVFQNHLQCNAAIVLFYDILEFLTKRTALFALTSKSVNAIILQF